MNASSAKSERRSGPEDAEASKAQAAAPEKLIFKVLGLLVTYPEEELVASMGELSSLIEESALSPEAKKGIYILTESLSTDPLLDSQERYVRLFDRSTRLSLYLYEHVHGESRDRGQAMVDLRSHYERFGLVATERELPDYVPVLCEFVSLLDPDAAASLLDEIAPLFALIGSRLEERKSLYAAVFTALVELAGVSVDTNEIERAASEDGVPLDDSFESLDRVWIEAEVTFGAGDAHDSCGGSVRPEGSDLVQLGNRPAKAPRSWTSVAGANKA